MRLALKAVWIDLVVGGTAIAILAASVFVAFKGADWHWFSRSGAILVLGGAILEYRNAEFLLDGGRSFRYTFLHGMAATEEGSRANIFLKWTAHIMVIVGTLIAGYGDLVASAYA